jgi:uncharacterized OB-fold protein
MDITRNWRLKTSRSQLMATRCPATGEVILPQQSGTLTPRHDEPYTFENEPRATATASAYAHAAR